MILVKSQTCFNLDNMKLEPVKNAVCKYCGKPFFKEHNKVCYCSEKCRSYALKEQKAEYQRKRRKLINSNVLVSRETEFIGTQFLSSKPRDDFDKEYAAIRKELKRLKLK